MIMLLDKVYPRLSTFGSDAQGPTIRGILKATMHRMVVVVILAIAICVLASSSLLINHHASGGFFLGFLVAAIIGVAYVLNKRRNASMGDECEVSTEKIASPINEDKLADPHPVRGHKVAVTAGESEFFRTALAPKAAVIANEIVKLQKGSPKKVLKRIDLEIARLNGAGVTVEFRNVHGGTSIVVPDGWSASMDFKGFHRASLSLMSLAACLAATGRRKLAVIFNEVSPDKKRFGDLLQAMKLTFYSVCGKLKNELIFEVDPRLVDWMQTLGFVHLTGPSNPTDSFGKRTYSIRR